MDTSSTSGHRASLVLESNSNELVLGTTGSVSELTYVGALTITSSATTFTGNVISKDTFYLENGSGNRWQMLFDTNAFNLRYYNGSSWSADAFAIDTSNNATFAGTISSKEISIKQQDDSGFDAGLTIERSANTQKVHIGMDGGAVNFNSPDGLSYKFRNNGSEKFTIDSSGNITPQSRITFDYGGDHYMETGTDTLSFKASSGTVQSTFNFSDLSNKINLFCFSSLVLIFSNDDTKRSLGSNMLL